MPDLTKDQAIAVAEAQAQINKQKEVEPPAGVRGLSGIPGAAGIPGLNLRGLGSLAEGLTSILSGGPAAAGGGAAGLSVLEDQGLEGAVDTIHDVTQKLTFEPRTPLGRQFAESAAVPFQALERGADIAGEAAFDSPGAQTAVKTGILALPMLAGLKRAPVKLNTKQQVSVAANQEGIIIPPGSTRTGPSIIEGLSGRPKMRMTASHRNIPKWKELANRALGRTRDEPLTVKNLEAYRVDKGKAYSVIDSVGDVALDTPYRVGVKKAVSDIKGAADEFPSVAAAEGFVDELLAVATDMGSTTRVARNLNSKSVRGMIGILRDKTDAAFRGGHTEVARAYRQLSKELESAIERDLGRRGAPGVVENFRNARKDIAKSYSVQEALIGDDIINPSNLKAQLKRGVPLENELELIAKVNEQFPQSTSVSPTIIEGPQSVSAVDFLTTLGGIGATAANPAFFPFAAAPLARVGARGGLLSGPGRQLGIPQQSHPLFGPAITTGGLLDNQ